MEKFGPLFKQFRVNKAFSIKDTAENIVSPQFLTRFEKGLCDISLNNFYLLLDRINVSFDEFMRSYPEVSVRLIDDFEERYDLLSDQRNNSGLRKMMQEYENHYVNTLNIKYKHLSLILKSRYLEYKGHTIEGVEIVQPVKAYLNKVETWGEYEFFLAAYISYAFEVEELHFILAKSYFKGVQNTSFRFRVNDFVINSIYIFLFHKKLDYAEHGIQLFYLEEEVSNFICTFPHHIMGKFATHLIDYFRGDLSGKEDCIEIIQFFESYPMYIDFTNRLYRLLDAYSYRNGMDSE